MDLRSVLHTGQYHIRHIPRPAVHQFITFTHGDKGPLLALRASGRSHINRIVDSSGNRFAAVGREDDIIGALLHQRALFISFVRHWIPLLGNSQ